METFLKQNKKKVILSGLQAYLGDSAVLVADHCIQVSQQSES